MRNLHQRSPALTRILCPATSLNSLFVFLYLLSACILPSRVTSFYIPNSPTAISNSVSTIYLLDLGENEEGRENNDEDELFELVEVGDDDAEEEEPVGEVGEVVILDPQEADELARELTLAEHEMAEQEPLQRERRRAFSARIEEDGDRDELTLDEQDEIQLLQRADRLRHSLENRAQELGEEISNRRAAAPTATISTPDSANKDSSVVAAVADGVASDNEHFPAVELNPTPFLLAPATEEPNEEVVLSSPMVVTSFDDGWKARPRMKRSPSMRRYLREPTVVEIVEPEREEDIEAPSGGGVVVEEIDERPRYSFIVVE